jgi:hypothetical protein
MSVKKIYFDFFYYNWAMINILVIFLIPYFEEKEKTNWLESHFSTKGFMD